MTVVVAASSRDVLGECPVHDIADGSLRWVDIGRSLWHRLDLGSGQVTTFSVEPALTAFAPTDKGDYIGAFVSGLARLDGQGKRGTWLAQPEADIATNRFNDAGTDPAGRLIAGTGCNAATGQYALRPLIGAGVIDLDDILIDLKAGVSGAGRSLKENLLHAELSGGTHSYSAGGKHRHLGEFDQEFSAIAGRPVHVQFTPHLAPMNRGILATVYVRGDAKTIHQTLAQAYENEPFLKVLPFGALPSTRDIAGSNFCHLGVIGDRIAGRAVVVAVLDNLTKGSSGQAIQNANLMLGIAETTGLMLAPVFP